MMGGHSGRCQWEYVIYSAVFAWSGVSFLISFGKLAWGYMLVTCCISFLKHYFSHPFLFSFLFSPPLFPSFAVSWCCNKGCFHVYSNVYSKSDVCILDEHRDCGVVFFTRWLVHLAQMASDSSSSADYVQPSPGGAVHQRRHEAHWACGLLGLIHVGCHRSAVLDLLRAYCCKFIIVSLLKT